MSQTNETFFTTVGCMDGRVQEVVRRFGKRKLGGLYPDTITEEGLVKMLGKESHLDPIIKEYLRYKLIDISINRHNSRGVIVYGHQDCTGFPVSDEEHIEAIRKATAFVKYLTEGTVSVFGVYLKQAEQGWLVEEVELTMFA